MNVLADFSTPFEYLLWVYGRIQTSESDVYRRQILPFKNGPRTVRVKWLLGLHVGVLVLIMTTRMYYTQQKQSICITFVQCRANVEDVGLTLHKCFTNVLCLLGNSVMIIQTTLLLFILPYRGYKQKLTKR